MTNVKLMERKNAALPRGAALVTSVFAEKANNAEIWDVEGKRYLDFAAGIAVLNTGHRNKKVMAAIAKQADKFTHTAFQVMPYEIYISLAERLNQVAPIKKAKTLLMTTGAEAVENAIKISLHHTKRPALISFTGSFHGRTALALSLTGKIIPYKAGFGTFAGPTFHAPFPLEHHGISVEQSLAALDRLFLSDVAADQVAAIIVEPIQGEGGFNIAPKSFMSALRSRCDKHGILLICDEIQTGFARTGKLFATEHYDLEPDIITVAKALAGGFPLSGIIGKAEVMDSPPPGGLGSTYGGSPIGCAAAHAVLDIIEQEQLCAKSVQIGNTMINRLKAMRNNPASLPIGDIRGLGAMVAFDLVSKRGSHSPDASAAKAMVEKSLENGLVLMSCGIYGNTMRLLTPLTISEQELDEGLSIIEHCLAQLEKEKQ